MGGSEPPAGGGTGWGGGRGGVRPSGGIERGAGGCETLSGGHKGDPLYQGGVTIWGGRTNGSHCVKGGGDTMGGVPLCQWGGGGNDI